MDGEMRIAAQAAPLRHEIENRLRGAIMAGRFRAGERLIERELCEMLGVSRPSLREALRQLEAEELVTIIPHRGPVVSAVGVAEAQSIFEVRAMLEGLAARLFAEKATDADIASLRRAYDDLVAAAQGRAAVSLIEAKTKFYAVLLDGCGNAVARRTLTQLHNRITLLRATSLSREGRVHVSVQEVGRIVEAIARRDPAAAWDATIEHIDHAAAAAVATLRNHESAQGEA
jgi:DNA-binding GntR family transcriptional regulator